MGKEEGRGGKGGRGEGRRWRAVAFSEMLIDVVNTMRNEPVTVTRDKHKPHACAS